MRRLLPFFMLVVSLMVSTVSSGQKFVHPGISQTVADLGYMRSQVLEGEQPWKDAFDRLKQATDLAFAVKPSAHVVRGPYGRPNVGGDDLSRGANLAYNCALVWFITGDPAYAAKAISIINAWSEVLWDFDYNDAKLLAGWTGHVWCDAAEILRYTASGWQEKDIDRFTDMLMTVYYPLMRFYYPQANGNWDGAILHSILAIAVFTDNREMFSNAVDHFLYGPVNGSIFKYIYPSGQCQETLRDQGHVQLGLGEFAGAARVAYTQGVDLFSAGDNRIALGYEYTAGFLLGRITHSYGPISERAKKLRDDYEYVYRHYTAMGLDMPYTKIAADSMRRAASRSVLTAFRAPGVIAHSLSGVPRPGNIAYPAGARDKIDYTAPPDAIVVSPGTPLQEALDAAAGSGRWVIAKAGLHTLPSTLKIPAGVTLAGEGIRTKLFLDPASGFRDAMVNSAEDLHDVVVRDLVIEGSMRSELPADPNSARSYRNGGNRGGIVFLGQHENQMKNINLINVTVQNCTYNGVFISGAQGVNIVNCDFNENGSSIVPGPRLQHNLLITRSSHISVQDSRLDTSPFGCGLAIGKSDHAEIVRCEISRNAHYGVLLTECRDVSLTHNFMEGNDRSAIMMEFLYQGSQRVKVDSNVIQYNDGFGVESYATKKCEISRNTYERNRNGNEKISNDRYIIMK